MPRINHNIRYLGLVTPPLPPAIQPMAQRPKDVLAATAIVADERFPDVQLRTGLLTPGSGAEVELRVRECVARFWSTDYQDSNHPDRRCNARSSEGCGQKLRGPAYLNVLISSAAPRTAINPAAIHRRVRLASMFPASRSQRYCWQGAFIPCLRSGGPHEKERVKPNPAFNS